MTLYRSKFKCCLLWPIIDGDNGIQFDNFWIIEGYTIGRENTYFAKEPVSKIDNNTYLIHWFWEYEKFGNIFFIKLMLFGKELNEYSLEYLDHFRVIVITILIIKDILKALIIKQYKLFLFQSDDAHEPNGELIGKFDDNFLI